MIKYLIAFLWVFYGSSLMAQNGKLLLIGGGSEKETELSWNSKAYKWAIDHSANKKVAIIAYGSADDWLPNYFKNQCGASVASNFNINSLAIAEAQATYDTLISYDVIFLKGGDQFNYYSTYSGRKVQYAIEHVYNNGGVICGTSAGLAVLSKVIYTAENGSAYSNETIENPFNNFVTLADDFFDFFPGYVFDSHFTIRSRFGRLLGFMEHWKQLKGELIVGIGIDEMTAMTIDENKLGTVYGIGTVNLYKAPDSEHLGTNSGHLVADSIEVTQLLQGCTYNFKTGETDGFTEELIPEKSYETANHTLFATGSDIISENLAMLENLVNQTGNSSDPILILAGTSQIYATAYKNQMINLGAAQVNIISATLDAASNSSFTELIASAKKIVFVENSWADLKSFIDNGNAGTKLKEQLQNPEIIFAFIGNNSRFAGKTIVDNYLVKDAAYYGQLTLTEGLGLLQTTAIIPNTYSSADYFENTAAAIPYAMVNSNLAYGILLNGDNYIKYQPQANNRIIEAGGTFPVMLLQSKNTGAGSSIQTAYGDGSDDFPNYSGFEKMWLSIIDETTPFTMGFNVGNSISTNKTEDFEFTLRNENPFVRISGPDVRVDYRLVDMMGRTITQGNFFKEKSMNLETFGKGLYIIEITNTQQAQKWTGKIYYQ